MGYGRWGRSVPDYPGRSYGPPPWAGYWEGCPCWCGAGAEPTRSERREELASEKRELEERLAEINKEIERV